MKKVYYLKSCSTCLRILKELDLSADFVLQDIKTETITETQLDAMKTRSGSYEALFSKRAQLYKQRNLKDKTLSETDFKHLILEHYTFLKRPVIILNEHIFVGNAKKTVEAAKTALEAL